jgi:hypothetical protein
MADRVNVKAGDCVGVQRTLRARSVTCENHSACLLVLLHCFQATSLVGGGLGDQPSYIVGFGPHSNWPRRVNHRCGAILR